MVKGRGRRALGLLGVWLAVALGVMVAERPVEVRRTPLETDTREGPRLEVLRRMASGGEREVSVRIHAPEQSEVRLEVPVSALAGWSRPPPSTSPHGAGR